MRKPANPVIFFLLIGTLCLSTTLRADKNSGFNPMKPSEAYGETVEYAIFRNGKRIGKHQLRFIETSNNLRVQIESDLTVRVLKIPVYRFNYKAVEQWTDGILQSVESTVKEKGKIMRMRMQREEGASLLTNKEGTQKSDPVANASNHWNPAVLTTNTVFNTLTGKINTVEIQKLGTEKLTISTESAIATHYRYSGELQADVWYDSTGRWLQLKFKGSDGSAIEYRSSGFARTIQ